MYGILSPVGVILLLIVYLILTVFSLVKMFAREKNLMLFVWLFIIIAFPYVGALLYLLYYYTSRFRSATPAVK